jgi:hypothetical protein
MERHFKTGGSMVNEKPPAILKYAFAVAIGIFAIRLIFWLAVIITNALF